MKNKSTLMMLLTAVSLIAPMAATAQQKQQRPPAPPMAEMATALGVSEQALQTCLPRPEGGQPKRLDVESVLSCLQADNAGLTSGKVQQVLETFAPKPPRK